MQGHIEHIAGAGTVETNTSETISARRSPTEGEAVVAGLVATSTRTTGPAGERGTSGHAQMRRQHIDKRSGSAREAVQADQDALTRDLHLCDRSGEDGERPQPCTPILAIASPANGSQKLMSVCVQHDRSGTHDVAACASVMTVGTHAGHQRRCGASSDSVWGSAHWRAPFLVPSTSATSQPCPQRSVIPPGSATGWRREDPAGTRFARARHWRDAARSARANAYGHTEPGTRWHTGKDIRQRRATSVHQRARRR
jgi:hypothetical protein